MRNVFLKLMLLAIVSLTSISVSSQSWITSYYYDHSLGITVHQDSTVVGPTEMCQSPDKSIFILNRRDQADYMQLIKIDSTGEADWIIQTSHSGGIFTEQSFSLHATNDNGCVYAFIHLDAPTVDSRVYRRSKYGGVVWMHSYQFPVVISQVIQTNYNTTLLNFGDSLVEVDSLGQYLRHRAPFYGNIASLNDSDMIVAYGVVTRQDFTGNIIWTDSLSSYTPVFADSSYIILKKYSNIIKLNSQNGAVIYNLTANNNDVSATSDQGLILCYGDTVTKFDSLGIIQWSRIIPFGTFGFTQIIECNANEFIAGGAYRCIVSNYSMLQFGYSSFFAAIDSTGHGVIDSTDNFFSGNANDNTMLSFADDGAYIGAALNNSGSARCDVQHLVDSRSVFCTNWNLWHANTINYKYSDVDGNGIIDTMDVVYLDSMQSVNNPVKSHWRLSNTAAAYLTVNVAEDTIAGGDSITVNIILGSQGIPIDSIYSLSLSVYPRYSFFEEVAELTLPVTQFGDPATDMYIYHRGKPYSYGNSQHLLMTRTDHQNRMPSGDTIAKFRIKTFLSMFSGVDIISADVGAVTVFGFPVTMNVINDSIFFSGINKISEEAKESVKIFPNPAHDKIFLQSINDLEKNYKIIDTSGRIVKSGSAGKEINIAGLDNGVYYIEIISNNEKYQQRIIKL